MEGKERLVKMICFNVPPFTGKEYEYIKQAVEAQKICGDGEFTKKCNGWFEEKTGTKKALLTTSCTHATESAALLAQVKPGDEVKPFTGANMALGDIFLRFDTREELDRIAFNSDEWMHIELK